MPGSTRIGGLSVASRAKVVLKSGLLAFSLSGLWGSQTGLDLYLQEYGITTLLFAGVNADQVNETMRVLCSVTELYFSPVCVRHDRRCLLPRVRRRGYPGLRRHVLAARWLGERVVQRR
jgi:hypothetical protein